MDDAGMLIAVLRTSRDAEIAAQIDFLPEKEAFVGAFPHYLGSTLSLSFGGLSRRASRRLIQALVHFAPPAGGSLPSDSADILDPVVAR
jgi:hypothetical protein